MVEEILENLDRTLERSLEERKVSGVDRLFIRLMLSRLKEDNGLAYEHSVRVSSLAPQVAEFTQQISPSYPSGVLNKYSTKPILKNTLYYPLLLHDIGRRNSQANKLFRKVNFDRVCKNENPIEISASIMQNYFEFSSWVVLNMANLKRGSHEVNSFFSNETNNLIFRTAWVANIVDSYDSTRFDEQGLVLESLQVRERLAKDYPGENRFINGLYDAKIFV